MFVIMNAATHEVDSVWDTIDQASIRWQDIQNRKTGFSVFALIES